MHNVFFIADTHFGHRLMLEFRGFKTIEEMDETLIARWNESVKDGDLVYHLGDFALCSNAAATRILERLKGRIVLVKGNHDRLSAKNRAFFEDIQPYLEIKAIGSAKLEQRITVCHYPFEAWRESHYGSMSLHGHSHGQLRTTRNIRRMDVGVDTGHNFRPYHYDEICEIMKTRGIDSVDQHEPRKRYT